MDEWHQRLDGHELGQTPGDGEGQGSLVCCSPWRHKESDTTEQQQQATREKWVSDVCVCVCVCE